MKDEDKAAQATLPPRELYRQLYEESPVAQFVVGVDGCIRSCNQAAARLLGSCTDQLAGRPVTELYADTPAGKPEAHQVFRRFLAGEVITDQELEMRRADGSSFWVDLFARPIHDAEGRLIESRSMVVDITRRKRAEVACRESEAKYHDLFESAYDVVFAVDARGNILDINGRGEVLTGYRHDELLAMNVLRDLVIPEDRPTVRQVLADVVEGRERVYEVRWRTRHGGILHFEGATTSRMGPTGEFLYTRCTLREITERKHAEEALRRSEADYRALVEQAPYGIYRSSAEGRFLTVNRTLVSMLGYGSTEELLAVDVGREIYIDPDERARLVARFHESDRIWGVQLEWKRKDGRQISVRLSGRTLRAEGGELLGFEMMAQDVTEQLALEQQVRQAQKMEAVGQLTSGIAHDFNNLLTVILANTELVAEALPAECAALRSEILEARTAARRGAEMIRKLLGFSRRTALELEPTDLAQSIRDVSRMLRRLLPETIEIAVAVEPNGPARADAGAVQQMIVNLATNARDAMPEGGILRLEARQSWLDEEHVTAHGWGQPGEFVCPSVSDTGMGMDERTRDRVFEPFFTTKPAGAGTGLGMSMVYGLMKQHAGFVSLYSELGHGTTVRLYFPALAADGRAQGAASTPEVVGGTETILLAEDEAAIRRTAHRVLERQGYTVIPAADGAEALALLRQHAQTVDLVISDLVMAKMGGRSLYDALRQEGYRAKFVFTSGYSAGDVRETAALDPGVPFLPKPWTVTELLRLVREVLDAGGR